MSETLYDDGRRQMLDVIAAYASLSKDATGKDALATRVMAAMAAVPRHAFVPPELRHLAYIDSPLPIGFDKTISQPFMVAVMTDLLDPQPGHSVLEIGTGLGYQAAVLAQLAAKVYTVEIIEELADGARRRLREIACANVKQRVGDGSLGWPEHAPYDRIMVTAAPELMPAMLLTQLKPGGRMVIPAGIADAQQLLLVEKDSAGKLKTKEIMPVRFSSLATSH